MSTYEMEDLELAQMMGDKFIDETVPPAQEQNETNKHTDTPEEKTAKKPTEAQWMPTKQRTFMDDLKDCTKSTLLFGGLNVLIWYWQMEGLMDESIALPSMIVCAVLAGIGIGKVFGGKR